MSKFYVKTVGGEALEIQGIESITKYLVSESSIEEHFRAQLAYYKGEDRIIHLKPVFSSVSEYSFKEITDAIQNSYPDKEFNFDECVSLFLNPMGADVMRILNSVTISTVN